LQPGWTGVDDEQPCISQERCDAGRIRLEGDLRARILRQATFAWTRSWLCLMNRLFYTCDFGDERLGVSPGFCQVPSGICWLSHDTFCVVSAADLAPIRTRQTAG
jgi:hypothetical protein